MEEGNTSQGTSKFKSKRGFKGLKPQSIVPLVHINTRPAMRVLSKPPEKHFGEGDKDLSDFPVLPTFQRSSPGNIPYNLIASPLFSKVLTEKSNSNFSNIKVQHPQEVLKSVKKREIKGTQTRKVEKASEPEESDKHNTDRNTAVVHNEVKQDLRQSNQQTKNKTSPVSKEQKPAASNSPGTSYKDSTNHANSPPDVGKVKRKHKRKSKKSSKLPQGKVNTITQEQYVAYTEGNDSKPAESSFNTTLESEKEYPALGFQFKLTNKTKVPNAGKKEPTTTIVIPNNEENQESSIPAVSYKAEVTSPPKVKKLTPDKKFNSPIEMNLMDMLSKMKKKSNKSPVKFQPLTIKREKVKSPNKHGCLNILDSSGPTRKRGKEREVPKKPRLSKLKKVILKERVERRLRVALLSMKRSKEIEITDNSVTSEAIHQLESNVQSLSLQNETEPETENENEQDVPVLATDQPSDIHMTTELETEEKQRLKCAKKLLHCRKFREYCNHFISEEMDTLTHNLLAELVRFQDRLFLKDPVKARARKRLICGLKEVTKNLKLKKLKLVIIAPDIEEINSEGGLNDALQSIFNVSENYFTPVIFSLPRRKLGRVCKKKVPLSCVGIFNYEGTEDIYKQLMGLVEEAKQVYTETLAFAERSLTCDMIQTLCSDHVDHEVVEKMRTDFWESHSRY